MVEKEIHHLWTFVLLAAAQSLLLFRIQLFHCATPLLCVHFAITMQRGYPKWASMLWCFAMGLVTDIFANTPGVGCAAMTLAAAMQPYLLEVLLPREAPENLRPSAKEQGARRFTAMAAIITATYCLTFFTLEAFTFSHWQQWLLTVAASTALTLALILVIETLRR